MTLPFTLEELRELLPKETDDLCELLVKAGQFDAAMVKIYEFLFTEGGGLTTEFQDLLCTACTTTTTTVTTTSTTTPTTTTTTTSAEVWAERNYLNSWRDIDGSLNGAVMVAVTYGGAIFYSADTGATWTAATLDGTPLYFQRVAMSASGVKGVAASSEGTVGESHLWYTGDSGANWTNVGPVTLGFTDVACSSDGTIMYAASGIYLYKSTDSGATWALKYTMPFSVSAYFCLACSSDGSIVYVGPNDSVIVNRLLTSTDGGTSFAYSASSPVGTYYRAASSESGQYVAAVIKVSGTSELRLYISSNFGVDFTQSLVGSFSDVDISGDGTALIAAASGALIQVSTDSGATWTPQATARSWFGVFVSGDGSRRAAVVNNGKIYTN